MQTIDHFNLRAFDAMMEEMNVTRAARRLKIQQPAMSHNISTLRTLFQDELFIRVGQEMKPTARALNLAGPVRQALRQAQAAVLTADVFDPATERRTFRLGMSSEVELLLLPDLSARLREIAPGIRILAPSAFRAKFGMSASEFRAHHLRKLEEAERVDRRRGGPWNTQRRGAEQVVPALQTLARARELGQ